MTWAGSGRRKQMRRRRIRFAKAYILRMKMRNEYVSKHVRVSQRRGGARRMSESGWAAIKDRYWLFLGVSLVAMLIGGAVPVVLIGPMMCGLYLCLLAKMRGEQVQFDKLFKGFDYFVPGLVAAAIQTVPIIM